MTCSSSFRRSASRPRQRTLHRRSPRISQHQARRLRLGEPRPGPIFSRSLATSLRSRASRSAGRPPPHPHCRSSPSLRESARLLLCQGRPGARTGPIPARRRRRTRSACWPARRPRRLVTRIPAGISGSGAGWARRRSRARRRRAPKIAGPRRPAGGPRPRGRPPTVRQFWAAAGRCRRGAGRRRSPWRGSSADAEQPGGLVTAGTRPAARGRPGAAWRRPAVSRGEGAGRESADGRAPSAAARCMHFLCN